MQYKPMSKTASTIIVIILLICMGLSYAYIVAGLKAKAAGANKEQTIEFLTGHLPWQWHKTFKLTPNPKEDNILTSEEPTEKPLLFIVYRFECPDCEKAYPYIKTKIAELDKNMQNRVWWVPSRTEAGKTFIEKHPIELVPTSVLLTEKESPITILYDPETKETNTNAIDNVFEQFTENS